MKAPTFVKGAMLSENSKWYFMLPSQVLNYYILWLDNHIDFVSLAHPIIDFVTKDVELLDTHELRLRCAASGKPRPVLSWTRNGQMQLTTARLQLVEDSNESNRNYTIDKYGNPISELDEIPFGTVKSSIFGTLQFHRYNEVSLDLVVPVRARKMSGLYQCIADNAIGRDAKSTEVSVLSTYQKINKF